MRYDKQLLSELKQEVKILNTKKYPNGRIITLGKFDYLFNGDFQYFETAFGDTILLVYDNGKYYTQLGTEVPKEDMAIGRYKIKQEKLEMRSLQTQLVDVITHVYFYIQRREDMILC